MNAAIEQSFSAAIAGAGLTPPTDIEGDGGLHRFSSNGKRGDKSGWYILHLDGVPAGTFGCWRAGLESNWCSKEATTMTEAERAAQRQRVQEAQAARDATLVLTREQAKATAQARWVAASPTTHDGHRYLVDKRVLRPYSLRQDGDALLVPLRDVSGTLHSLQTITPTGEKRFLTGGRVAGCYCPIGELTPSTPALVVCEGYATGATIHEATGYYVACAMNAGNLQAVAQALRTHYPQACIVIAGDDDWRTAGNPGLTAARQAANAVNGVSRMPRFGDGRPDNATDFNDLEALSGLDEVREQLTGDRVAGPAVRPSTGFESLEPNPFDGPPAYDQAGAAGDAVAWAEPTPLPTGLPPVTKFDIDLLPHALRGWVADIAGRMQCPTDFPAVGALVALSSLIGARVVVRPKAHDDWTVVPVLWGVVVGRPGVMKSPALSEALKPLHRLESTERELYETALSEWELDAKVAEMASEANAKQAKALAIKDPTKARELLRPVDAAPQPIARRYLVNDATVEKLGELLTQNPWGILTYRDELHGLLTSMDKQGQEGARAFYLQAYDGNQGYTFDRIGRGVTRIERVCMAMLGGIQPGKVQSYVREAVSGGASDDGLLQRFGLAVWPDIDADFQRVDRWPDTAARQEAWAVFERLNALQPTSDTEPQVWRFSPEAQELYWEWALPFERNLRSDELHPALVSHLAKYRKLIPALALIFALIDTPDSGNTVGTTELIRALAWGDYLRTHAERLYAAAIVPESAGAQTLLTKIKAGKLTGKHGAMVESFAPREVAVKHWAGLSSADEVRKAATMLTDYGWLYRDDLRTVDALGRTRSIERYLVNPSLLSGVVV